MMYTSKTTAINSWKMQRITWQFYLESDVVVKSWQSYSHIYELRYNTVFATNCATMKFWCTIYDEPCAYLGNKHKASSRRFRAPTSHNLFHGAKSGAYVRMHTLRRSHSNGRSNDVARICDVRDLKHTRRQVAQSLYSCYNLISKSMSKHLRYTGDANEQRDFQSLSFSYIFCILNVNIT